MAFTYRGLTASFSRHAVTDSEVEQHLQRLRQQTPRIEEVTDRPTQRGDEVVLDYAGFCDGEQFPGGTAERQTLTLGSGAFIPGFEEQLLDKVPGEEVVVKVTFPAEYHAPELAGKDAEFRCKIHQIRIKSTYALDDTFAKEFGNFENLEQMRQELKKSLQAYSDERGEMDLQDRLLRQVVETMEVTFTEEQIQMAMDDQIQTLKAQLGQQGLTLEMYCAFLKTDEAAIREESRAAAEAALRGAAAVERIVELEGLEPTKEELAQALAAVCRQNNLTTEQVKPYYNAEFEQALSRSILTGKVMELIRQNATVTVVEK